MKNTGNIDRSLRILIGLGLIAITQVGPHTLWGWIGAIPLLTALVGFCPLYKLLGLSTCPHCK